MPNLKGALRIGDRNRQGTGGVGFPAERLGALIILHECAILGTTGRSRRRANESRETQNMPLLRLEFCVAWARGPRLADGCHGLLILQMLIVPTAMNCDPFSPFGKARGPPSSCVFAEAGGQGRRVRLLHRDSTYAGFLTARHQTSTTRFELGQERFGPGDGRLAYS